LNDVSRLTTSQDVRSACDWFDKCRKNKLTALAVSNRDVLGYYREAVKNNEPVR